MPTFIEPYPANCELISVVPNRDSMRLYYAVRRYLPVAPDIQGAFLAAPQQCTDCRIFGGTTDKPSYW
ncbi:MAG: hypothetical protein H3C56_08165 [Chitinophagaceae bacterium]|nr:hypothetical protein [Chitinophagaceae bacterium]